MSDHGRLTHGRVGVIMAQGIYDRELFSVQVSGLEGRVLARLEDIVILQRAPEARNG